MRPGLCIDSSIGQSPGPPSLKSPSDIYLEHSFIGLIT